MHLGNTGANSGNSRLLGKRAQKIRLDVARREIGKNSTSGIVALIPDLSSPMAPPFALRNKTSDLLGSIAVSLVNRGKKKHCSSIHISRM